MLFWSNNLSRLPVSAFILTIIFLCAFKWTLMYFSLWSLSSVLSASTTEKGLALSSLLLFERYWLNPLWAFSSTGWSIPALSASPPRTNAPVYHLYSPLLVLVHCAQVSLALRDGAHTMLLRWPHQCWVEVQDHVPWPTGNALCNAGCFLP